MSSPVSARQAVILVGGRGTRLGAVTDTIPKPLVPVAGRPFLDWLIDDLARFGLGRITLLAGYLGTQFETNYAGKVVGDTRIEVLVEPEPLGTAGGLRLFRDQLDDRFFMLNGDTRFNMNLLDLPLHAQEAVATLALCRAAPGARYGIVNIDEDGAIEGFLARSPDRFGPINAGVYWLSKQVIAWIPNGPVSFEADIFPRLAAARQLRGAIYNGAFIDIGVPDDLVRAQAEIPAMARRPVAIFDGGDVLLETSPVSEADVSPRWASGAVRAIKRLNDNGYLVVAAVPLRPGEQALDNRILLRRRMNLSLAEAGAHIDVFMDALQHTPYDTTAVRPAWLSGRDGSFIVSSNYSMRSTEIPTHWFSGGHLDGFIAGLLESASGRGLVS